MSVLTRGRRGAEERGSTDRFVAAALRSMGVPMGNRSVSQTVTPDTAMKHSGVAACVQKIVNLASLDLGVTRTVDGEEVPGLTPPLLREPSATLGPMEWRRQVIDGMCRRGAAYGLVAAVDANGYPTQIELIPASSVSVEAIGQRKALTEWQWKVDGQNHGRWPDGDLWVAPGIYTQTGVPVGISPIEMALGAIGVGLAAQDFGQSWFDDGAVPSGIIESPQALDETSARTLKQRFVSAVNGREPAVLGAGQKYTQISVAANESQFLDTIDKNIATVARYFLIPPEEIGASSGSSMTYANQEARSIALLVGCYGPWIAHIEDVFNICTPRPQRVRIDESGLLRLDAKTRADIDAQDAWYGIRSREEIRRGRPGLPTSIPDTDHSVWPPRLAAKEATDEPDTPSEGDGVPQPTPGGGTP